MASESEASSATDTYVGRCACGAVEVSTHGAPVWSCYCHCSVCRRFHSTPCVLVVAFLVDKGSITLTKGAERVSRFRSPSGRVERCFCTTCGTRVYNILGDIPGVGTVWTTFPSLFGFETTSAMPPGWAPTMHVYYENRVGDVCEGGLPRWRDMPAELGGSGATA